MSPPEFPTPPHQYPQEIQLKLYQAFIFSIPILLSIILFLLFYLFYLKRRASTISTALPTTIHDASPAITAPCGDSDLKTEVKNKLCKILFDEYMKSRDSLCCVCLGEFEVKEELVQVGWCKHVFHADCITHWLHNNSTCPLCRAPVVPQDQYLMMYSTEPHHQSPRTLQLQHDRVRSEGSSSASSSIC